MLFKRAQAAMEFLMTYGWAILVVLIVVGALAYFGVLNPQNLIPEKCVFPTMLTCQDYLVTPGASGTISVKLVNGAGQDMSIYFVNFTADSTVFSTAPYECKYVPAVPPDTLLAGASATYTTLACGWSTTCNTGCGKKKFNVYVQYKTATIQHMLQGELFAAKSG